MSKPGPARQECRAARLGLPLDGFAEGPYELVLEGRDEATGTRLERRESFHARAGGGGGLAPDERGVPVRA